MKNEKQQPRSAPLSIRFTRDHNRLIHAALKQAGISKSMHGWFPRLLVILLVHYVGETK